MEFYTGDSVDDLQLEEVELTEDEKYWLITLGFAPAPSSAQSTPLPAFLAGIRPSAERKYRVFKVNAENGKVLSMKMRET